MFLDGKILSTLDVSILSSLNFSILKIFLADEYEMG